jgi:outer membrane protein assembly factor BamE (lipoprotein component of BamABCDE complex)
MKRLKRYRYSLIGLALLVLLAAGSTILQNFSTPSRINSANFAKIPKGMTQEEVLAMIGKPLFTFGKREGANEWWIWTNRSENLFPWEGNNIDISIDFDENGRVEKADLTIQKRNLKERFAKYLPD